MGLIRCGAKDGCTVGWGISDTDELWDDEVFYGILRHFSDRHQDVPVTWLHSSLRVEDGSEEKLRARLDVQFAEALTRD